MTLDVVTLSALSLAVLASLLWSAPLLRVAMRVGSAAAASAGGWLLQHRAVVAAVMAAGSVVILGSAKLPVDVLPDAADVLSEGYELDRQARVNLLRVMSRDYQTQEDRLGYFNAQSSRITAATFAPFLDAVAEAAASDRLAELADRLER